MKQLIMLTFVLSALISCNSANEHQKNEGNYFDVKGYISGEANKLAKEKRQIRKTVSVDGSTEEKTLFIEDWHTELSAFIDAEINRKSWEGLFRVHKTADAVTYTTTDSKVPVKVLKIKYSGDRLKELQIIVTNSNMLYTSEDSLSYYPDSLYQIHKTQKIRFLKEKRYQVTGKLK